MPDRCVMSYWYAVFSFLNGGMELEFGVVGGFLCLVFRCVGFLLRTAVAVRRAP